MSARLFRLVAAAAFLGIFFWVAPGRAQPAEVLPEFTNPAPEAWINSKPLTRKDLLGQVGLIEIWTSS